MKPEALIIIIGGFLILIGIIGGGFTIKEVTLPKIPTSNRIIATIFGLILVGIGMYLSLFSMPTDKTPWALIKEFDKFEEKINNDIITILENLEQKQESKVREAVKQISRKQGQPKEQINILDELEIAQKKNSDETSKESQLQLINEIEKSKKDLEHKFLDQKEIIEEEQKRIEDEINQRLEKRIAEINSEWKDKLELAKIEFRNQQQEQARAETEQKRIAEENTRRIQQQEQARAETEQKRIAEENTRRIQQQEQAARIAEENAKRILQTALAEQKRIQEQARAEAEAAAANAKRKAEAQNLVREYWIAVGQRDIETAIGKWDNPSIQKQDSLRGIISAKESLKIKDIRIDNHEKDNARVSFTIIYKDKNSLEKHGVGTFSLKFIDNSWKITNITSWTAIPYHHTE